MPMWLITIRDRTWVVFSGFPPTWKVRESQGKSGNLGGQGKSGKKSGNFEWSQGKRRKKEKRERNERTRNKKEREICFMALITLKKKFKKKELKKIFNLKKNEKAWSRSV